MKTEDVLERERARRPDQGHPPGPPASTGRGPSRPRRIIAWITAALVGMAVGGVAVYGWQHGQLLDRQSSIVAITADRDGARVQIGTLTGTIAQLQAKLRAEQTAADANAATLRAKLGRLEAQLEGVAGPALADGRYPGYVITIGPTQSPPKLVFDEIRFFTGPAADQAAREDGNLPPGEEHVPNDVYIRNTSPRWRILSIEPTTDVSLVTYPFGDIESPARVTLGRFAKILRNGRGAISSFPFWITVRQGTVVAIEQQYMP